MKVTRNDMHGFGDSITHLYQPICNIKRNTVAGYEALMRDSLQMQRSPGDIFLWAKKQGVRSVLDLTSVRTAVRTYMTGPQPVLPLFLNIYPSTLLEEDFMSWWRLHIPRSIPIVLELLENEAVKDWKELRRITGELRSEGVRLAIDDLGNGYSFFQQWIELYPDYIKLDRYYAQNLSTSRLKQKVIEGLLSIFSDKTEIILEGIETREDLAMAELLGIANVQGYLLGKPEPVEKLCRNNDAVTAAKR